MLTNLQNAFPYFLNSLAAGIGLSVSIVFWVYMMSLVTKKKEPDPALKELKHRNELTERTHEILERIASTLEERHK